MQVPVAELPELRFPEVTAKVPVVVLPARSRLQTVGLARLALPVFVRMIVHTSGVPLQFVTLAETLAVEVKVPNRPNTKPATAIAAMSVMAIRITVANTGLIAFRFVVGRILMAISSYEPVPEKRALPPLARMTDPVTCEPAGA